MPDLSAIDFDHANHLQRKAVRAALTEVFTRCTLTRFLDEELGLVLAEVVEAGPLKDQFYELITYLTSRGKLNELMETLYSSKEFEQAPALAGLLGAWQSVGSKEKSEPRRRTSTQKPASPPAPNTPLEQILDGQVQRMRPVTMLVGVAVLRRRVCMLVSENGPMATGFLIGPQIVMTTAYVAHSPFGQPSPIQFALFDYGIAEDEKDGSIELAVRDLVAIDPVDAPQDTRLYFQSADYAVFRLENAIGEEDTQGGSVRGWFDLTNKRERLREGESVFMLHHPEGGPMMISEGVLSPHDIDGRIRHSCATIPGSSGAPLIDASLRLVGMHEGANRGRQGYGNVVRADWIDRSLSEHDLELVAPPGY